MWKTSAWRLGSFAQAVISARLNVEDTGLAVGLLRASAHPTCLAHAPRLEDSGLAVGLLRASAHPTCLAARPSPARMWKTGWRLGSFARALIPAARVAAGSADAAATAGVTPTRWCSGAWRRCR